MRFSASKLKTWMSCPLQAHFKYDQRLYGPPNAKAVFGTCIHAALELYNQTANVELAITTFKDLWHNPEKVGAPTEQLAWPKMTSYGGLRDRGIQILRRYHEQQKWDKREVVATEHRFLVPFGHHELTGVVDLVEVRTSGNGKTLMKIEDYKSSTKAPTTAELALDIQFTVYTYASLQPEFWTGLPEDHPEHTDFPGLPNGAWLYETYQEMPRRAIWYHLWNQREIDAGPREDVDFMRLYRVCDEIARATELEIFVPKIGEACGLCDFANGACPISVPTRPELAEQETAWL